MHLRTKQLDSKRRPLFRDKKTAHIRALRFQEGAFFIDTARVPREAPVRRNDAMTGYDDRYAVVPDRPADSLRGYPLPVSLSSRFAICPYVTVCP